ncbi:MAG TPA: response regulator [Thermoanaerobaculia bacterium]|nr:response regulator [Thermoanaerobaculia bacterium]
MTAARILVVEDGREYVEGFARLAAAKGSDPAFVHARSLAEAREALREGRPDAVFLDVVFDRTPEAELAGDLDTLVARYGGDRARAVRHLATHQGFYILDALADALAGVRVVLAYDFTGEEKRLASLRERVPALSGLPDGASLGTALEDLLRR